MPHGEISENLPVLSPVAFDVLHDYSRRLAWDTLLQAAYLEPGQTAAGEGVTSVCVGRWSLGGLALRTTYVTFERPRLAAVKMVNAPPFFQAWAASIHHRDISERESRLTYKFHFTTKPRVLRWLLDPVLERLFRWETRRRLRALKRYLSPVQTQSAEA